MDGGTRHLPHRFILVSPGPRWKRCRSLGPMTAFRPAAGAMRPAGARRLVVVCFLILIGALQGWHTAGDSPAASTASVEMTLLSPVIAATHAGELDNAGDAADHHGWSMSAVETCLLFMVAALGVFLAASLVRIVARQHLRTEPRGPSGSRRRALDLRHVGVQRI